MILANIYILMIILIKRKLGNCLLKIKVRNIWLLHFSRIEDSYSLMVKACTLTHNYFISTKTRNKKK